MPNQISWFIRLIAFVILCLTTFAMQSAYSAPDFPSEKTVQELTRAFVYSQASLDPEEHKRLESIYYFDSQEDRARYLKVIKLIGPVSKGWPRFLGPDGIPLSSDYELFRPEDVLVVPPPADLTDDAEPMAIIFYPHRWLTGNYTGPGILRFVHTDRGWLIRFETYKPTPKESRHNGDIYMKLKAAGLRVERTRWANATGDNLMALVRQHLNRIRYQRAAAEYALAHDIRMGDTKGGTPYMTKEKLRRGTQLTEHMFTMTPAALRAELLKEFDAALARYAENERKLEQGRKHVRQLDEKQRQP